MTKKILITVFLSCALSLTFTNPAIAKDKKVELKTNKDKTSYIVGRNLVSSLGPVKDEIDIDLVMEGIKDSLNGKESRVTGEEAQVLMQELAQNVQQKVIKQQKEISTKNAEESEAFLAANKEKEGVKTTESGLQYLVLTEGDGPTPTAASRVKVHYSGTLIDGTEFDSSYKRGQPAVFPVGAVIKGWTEALQMMKVGSKYKLFIPSNLAYGKQGAGAIVGPNAVLIFEVELLGIEE